MPNFSSALAPFRKPHYSEQWLLGVFLFHLSMFLFHLSILFLPRNYLPPMPISSLKLPSISPYSRATKSLNPNTWEESHLLLRSHQTPQNRLTLTLKFSSNNFLYEIKKIYRLFSNFALFFQYGMYCTFMLIWAGFVFVGFCRIALFFRRIISSSYLRIFV